MKFQMNTPSPKSQIKSQIKSAWKASSKKRQKALVFERKTRAIQNVFYRDFADEEEADYDDYVFEERRIANDPNYDPFFDYYHLYEDECYGRKIEFFL